MATKKVSITPELEKSIENILHDKLAHMLEDITFRIGQEYELRAQRAGEGKGTVYAEDLHVKDRVYMTGYTITQNSPTAGSVAWADLHVVVDGVDHTITNGNTALKYLYFTKATTPTTLKMSATKPVLAEGDVLLFINEAGVPRNMLSDTNGTLPRAVATSAIDTDSIAANVVTANELNNSAVTAGKIATGAINNANLISGKIIGSAAIVDNSISTLNLAPNAVDSTILKDGAITRSAQISGKIITGGALVDNTITSTQLGASAVGSSELAAGAIDNTNKFTGKVITGTNMVDSTITGTQLGSGAVSATKLSIMRHVMY